MWVWHTEEGGGGELIGMQKGIEATLYSLILVVVIGINYLRSTGGCPVGGGGINYG